MTYLRPFAACLLLAACGAPSPAADEAACPEDDYCDGFGLEPDDPRLLSGGKADATFGSWPAAGPLPESCTFEQALEVFFTPDDPAVTLELSWIDRVVQARQADEKDYAEGDNPYRIRYAVYNLSHSGIAGRLIQAERAGVDVQVLIEADQLDKPWSRTTATFANGDLDVVKDYRGVGQDDLASADLVGIKEKGLMHLKLRLFETPDEAALLTGSYNPNQSAGANEENLHVIRDATLIERYGEAFDAVLHARPFDNTWDDDAAVNVVFTPEGDGVRSAERILDWLESEQEQILLMVFSLRNVTAPDGTRRSLVGVLKQKVEEGVPVYVITDRKQADGVDLEGNRLFWDDWTDDKLRDVGVTVYEAINDASSFFGTPYPYSAMHHKVAVLGLTRMRVIADAANWTVSALGSWKKPARNVESTLFIDSAKLDDNATGRRYLAQWLKVLERYAHQSVRQDGEEPPDGVVQRLRSAVDWPTQQVTFSAEAHTEMGEMVWVVGDHDALGRWGQAHPGVPLTTTADTYPVWYSNAPVVLPLDQRFEWKLVIRNGAGEARWEGGGNRTQAALPAVCSGQTETWGAWR